MPTYVYRREDGSTFEIKQRITADPLETCPETGQPVTRLITGSTGLIFKGDGFYVNDYGRGAKGAARSEKAEAVTTNGDAASSDTSDTSDKSASGESTSASESA